MVVLGAVAAAGIGCASAAAADGDRLLWTNYWSRTIETADTSGTGSSSLYQYEPAHDPPLQDPFGVAVDMARGAVYWAALGNASIAKGSLDGATQPEFVKHYYAGQPRGLAIDPASQYLYWTGLNSGDIMRMHTDGSGFETIYARSPGAMAPVVDPPSGRVYWIDATYFTPTIAYGSLDGSAPVTEISLAGCPGTVDLTGLGGLAVDPARGVAYVATRTELARIGLDGSACTYLAATPGDPTVDVWGLALDPDAGRLYWPKGQPTNSISSLALDPLGAPLAVSTLSGHTFPTTPVILSRPAGSVAVTMSSTVPSSTLTCSATWSGDQLAGSRYRVPSGATTYAWLRDGSAIAGASGASLNAATPGSYECLATAANAAGRTTLRSRPTQIAAPDAPTTPAEPAAVSVATVRVVWAAPRLGRIESRVALSAAGTVRQVGRLSGGAVACRSRAQAFNGRGSFRVMCATGPALRAARSSAAVTVVLTTTFTPATGAPVSTTRRVVLPALRIPVTG